MPRDSFQLLFGDAKSINYHLMNHSALTIGIVVALVGFAAIFRLVLYLRTKRGFALFPVRINYVRRDHSAQGPFLYLELEMKNSSGKSIFVSEVQQRNMEGPLMTFLLQDAQGRTKRSLFEIREHFSNKAEIKDGHSLYRYDRMDLLPSILNTKLYLRYRVITTASIAVQSKGVWVVPSALEQMPFKPRK